MTRNTIKRQVFKALDSGLPLTQIWNDLRKANPHRGYGWNYMTKLHREWQAERSRQDPTGPFHVSPSAAKEEPMKTINVNEQAMAAIRAAAEYGFKQTAVRQPDGSYNVPLADDTYERFASCMFEGESASDCLIRLAAFWTSQGRAQ